MLTDDPFFSLIYTHALYCFLIKLSVVSLGQHLKLPLREPLSRLIQAPPWSRDGICTGTCFGIKEHQLVASQIH